MSKISSKNVCNISFFVQYISGNGYFDPIPVRTPGRFGPIPFRLGRFGPTWGVGRFGPFLYSFNS